MLATLAQLKAYLQVSSDDVSSDSLYTDLLTRAQAEVTDELGLSALESTVVTDERHDSSAIIVPDMRPFVTNFVMKYINDFSGTPADTTLTAYTDYIAYPSHVVCYLHRDEGDSGRMRIKLSYTGGYTVATVPAPIVEAIILTAAYQLQLNQPLQPGTSTDRRTPANIKSLLEPYARLRTP